MMAERVLGKDLKKMRKSDGGWVMRERYHV
jgi:hypothetical protein